MPTNTIQETGDVYVVDTGEREIYVLATDECDAAEQVAAMGEPVNYAEWYSDDPSDLDDKVTF